MSKFTPGPWAVQQADECMGRKLDELVQWVVTADGHSLWISTGPTWDPEYAEEGKANARLIAAAPDLLEALIDAVCALECCGKDYPAAEKARAAIAKARGDA